MTLADVSKSEIATRALWDKLLSKLVGKGLEESNQVIKAVLQANTLSLDELSALVLVATTYLRTSREGIVS